MSEKLRLDHYLFRARLFKSRSQATSACKEGKVQINGELAKASSEIGIGDKLAIREKGLYREYKVDVMPGKNMPKAEAKQTWSEVTPEDVQRQYEMMNLAQRQRAPFSDQGSKPTKKERRDMDKWRKR